jgi:hypothetical protein
MFVALIPTAFHDFASMGFILLPGCIGEQPDIVVNIKIEQRS